MSARLKPIHPIAEPARAALVDAIRALVGDPRFRTLQDLSNRMRGRPRKQRLSELARGEGKPAERHEIIALTEVCDPQRTDTLLRLLHNATAEREGLAAVRMPRLDDVAETGVVSSYSNWEALGIHRPITRLSSGTDLTDRVMAGELPGYVLREADAELRTVLAGMAAGAGPVTRMVVITGESLAGKTRSAVEAMRSELSSWRLFIPYGADSLATFLDQRPSLRYAVVWLDEVQNYLSERGGPEQIRRLLAASEGPTVLLGTLRSDRETALSGTAGGDLLRRRAHRIVLKRRPPRPQMERELARAVKLDDPWISEALERMGSKYGIAEWLAAGPQLQTVLETCRATDATVDRVAAAIVDAATDCYRAGYHTPCPEPLLRSAHQIHLDDPTIPTPPETFNAALVRAQEPVAGAVGMLDFRRIGYVAFDYLLGLADQPSAPPPDVRIWPLLRMHLTDRCAMQMAVAAHRHGQQQVAESILSRVHPYARAEILAAWGDVQRLTELVDAGDEGAPYELVNVLARQDATAALAARADAGHDYAAQKLAEYFRAHGDNTALAERADAGDRYAARLRAELMAEQGNLAPLESCAAAGDLYAARHLTRLLIERGDLDGLIARIKAGDRTATVWMVGMQAEAGNPDALAALASAADAGNDDATWWLYRVLTAQDDLDVLTARADAGKELADIMLAGALRRRGDTTALAIRADAGDRTFASALAHMLCESGDLVGLAARADAGDWDAAVMLARILSDHGDLAGLAARADVGDRHAAYALNNQLAERGDALALAARAATGDEHAVEQLARLRTIRG